MSEFVISGRDSSGMPTAANFAARSSSSNLAQKRSIRVDGIYDRVRSLVDRLRPTVGTDEQCSVCGGTEYFRGTCQWCDVI